MLKTHARRVNSLVHFGDAAVAALIFFSLVPIQGLVGAEGDDIGVRVVAVGLVSSMAWPVLLEWVRLYESLRLQTVVSLGRRHALAGILAVLTIGAGAWMLSADLPPEFPFVCGAIQASALFGLRLGALIGLRLLRRAGRNFRNVLILGSGSRAHEVSNLIENNRGWGLRVLGFADSMDSPAAPELLGAPVHKFVDIPSLIRESVVDEVIVAVPRSMLVDVAPSVATCAAAGIPVTMLADIFGGGLPQPRPARLASLSTLSFAPVYHSSFQLGVKRIFDVVGSVVLLALLAPVMAVVALVVRRSSPGPVFFRQTRVGLYGRTFDVLKFRTMYEDAESRLPELEKLNDMKGPVFKMREDPRVTPQGRFLRKWSLDELPQLWNVLRGEMSLVGPRPPLRTEVMQYSTIERRRLSMRPGLTCLWQVSGRNSIPFDQWVELDFEYIDRWSLILDVEILLKTMPAVLRGDGL